MAECEDSSETQYFWFRTTLDATDRIGEESVETQWEININIYPCSEDAGGIRYWNLLCLIGAWIIVYLILMKGRTVKSHIADPSITRRVT